MRKTTRIIHGGQMCYGPGTNVWTFSVYEATGNSLLDLGHSSIMHGMDLGGFNGWAGRLGSRRLPKWIDAIPYSPRRVKIVGRWHRAQYRAAYKLILGALPQLFRSYRVKHGSMGDVTVEVLAPASTPRSVNLSLN